jgi:hypothetical protein
LFHFIFIVISSATACLLACHVCDTSKNLWWWEWWSPFSELVKAEKESERERERWGKNVYNSFYWILIEFYTLTVCESVYITRHGDVRRSCMVMYTSRKLCVRDWVVMKDTILNETFSFIEGWQWHLLNDRWIYLFWFSSVIAIYFTM